MRPEPATAARVRRLPARRHLAAAGAAAAGLVLTAAMALATTPASAATACQAARAGGRVTCAADTTAPSVTIVSPRNGSLLGSGSTIEVQAAASGGCCAISSVAFYATNTFSGSVSEIGVATASPYQVPWKVPASFFTLTAVVTNAVGQTSTSPPVTVYVAVSDPP